MKNNATGFFSKIPAEGENLKAFSMKRPLKNVQFCPRVKEGENFNRRNTLEYFED